jgi:hypothetical protein
MTNAASDEARLRAALRKALADAEPREVPAFGSFLERIGPGSGRRATARLRVAVAAALIAAIAAIAWFSHGPTPADDYRLAVTVVAGAGHGTPTDRWLALAPATPVAGLPAVPRVEYPLLPEEVLL